MLEKEDADVLIEPKFEFETAEGLTTVTVTGFPATFKNFRPMNPDDARLLETNLCRSASVYEHPKEPKGKSTGPVIATILGFSVILITLILAN